MKNEEKRGGQPRRKFNGSKTKAQNTSGVREGAGPTKEEIAAFRKAISDTGFQLTELEKSVLYGELLSDGHLQKRGNSYRLRVSHKLEHASYANWLYERLKRLCLTTHPPRLNAAGDAVEFYTATGPYLKAVHELFYQRQLVVGEDGTETVKWVKTMTPELLAELPTTPEFLAVVWCSDGSVRSDCYAGRLAFQGFSRVENLAFSDWLKQNYGLETVVVLHSRKKGQVTISVPASAFPKLVSVVEPVIVQIPELRYKLNEQRKNRSKYL